MAVRRFWGDTVRLRLRSLWWFWLLALLVASCGSIAAFGQHLVPGPSQGYDESCVFIDAPPSVIANGRGVCGPKGVFHPLGITYFSALRLQRYDRAANLKNLDLLQKLKFDYVRILGMIDWPGLEIDPRWPEYEAVLASFIDDAYARGIYTQLTVVGGYAGRDPLALTHSVLRVLESRWHKVIYVDQANERDVNNQLSTEHVVTMVRAFRQAFPLLLVATGSELLEDTRRLTALTGANFAVHHVPRVDHKYANGWFNTGAVMDLNLPHDNQEPVGPCSSIAQMTEPVQLALQRASSIIGGAALYVFHVGDGITSSERFEGRDCGRMLHTYFGDVPNFEAMATAVQRVDRLLPANVENWDVTPMSEFLYTRDYWTYREQAAHGITGMHATVKDDRFVGTVHGVLHHVVLTAARPLSIEVYDPVTLERVTQARLLTGQTIRLAGAPDGMAGYVVKGILQ